MIRALALCLLATPAAAEPGCGSPYEAAEMLASDYGEGAIMAGSFQSGGVMVLFANRATGTWTVTVSQLDGTVCVVAAGVGLEQLSGGLPANN